MRAERTLLSIGDYLVSRACQQLPRAIREQRHREWAAELPAILHDPQTGPAPRRAIRMLGYAADTVRGAALTHVRAAPPRRTAGLCLLLVADTALVIWAVLDIVGAPGDPLNYLRLAWNVLLAACPLSMLMRSTWRVRRLIASAGTLLGVAVCLWDAARAPADWFNYAVAALLFLLLSIMWITVWFSSRRARTGQAQR